MALCMKELYWAAGFLEGEGSFTASRCRRPDGSLRAAWQISVNAGQVNREPLERLKSIFGGKIYGHPNGGKQPCWRWQVANRYAIGIMLTVWSLMSDRRKAQIEDTIAKWKSNQPPNGKNHLHAVKRGMDHPHSKLTDAQVAEIRSSPLSQSALGRMYGVRAQTIGKIKRNESRVKLED